MLDIKNVVFNTKRKYVFPGSFNPLHDGHIAISRHVHVYYDVLVDFEISIHNVDKPNVKLQDLKNRIKVFEEKQQSWFGTLYITECDMFKEKALKFPDSTFIVGFDTFARIADPKYYFDINDMEKSIKIMNFHGIKWLVFPRYKQDGTTTVEKDFEGFPDLIMKNTTIEWDFQPLNISSTEIRDKK